MKYESLSEFDFATNPAAARRMAREMARRTRRDSRRNRIAAKRAFLNV